MTKTKQMTRNTKKKNNVNAYGPADNMTTSTPKLAFRPEQVDKEDMLEDTRKWALNTVSQLTQLKEDDETV